MLTPLDYLDFDYSEDPQGNGSFDAMAAAAPQRLAQLQAEVVRVLDWATRAFGAHGPLEEGCDWDCELQGTQEVTIALQVTYEPAAGQLQVTPGADAAPRVTLSLTLSGTPAFCTAFRQQFALG